MNGSIRIKTRIDNSELPKDIDGMIKEIERLKQEQKELNEEAKKLDLNAKNYEKNANVVRKQIKELEAELEKLKAFQEYSFDKGEYADYGKQIAQKQQELDILKKEEDAYDETLGKLEDIKYKLEENKELQEQWNNKISKVKEDLAKSDGIKDAIGNIGTSIKGVIKKTIKWGLAIFSIRSAYMLIRQTASTLSQYNDELRTKIEGIRLALASALEPVITKIVDLVIELLRYINSISVSLFGWDLFKNAKNMKSMSKSAKEIKNSLAGFDEMNVLADSSTNGAGGGANAIDLSPKDLDTSVFYNWIDKVKEIILKGFDAIKENVKKVLKELGVPSVFINAWVIAFETIEKVIEGLFTTVKGAFELLVGFITGDTEKVKEGFIIMLKGIFTAVSAIVLETRKIALSIASDTWEGIKKIFSKVGEFFKTTFTNAWEAVKKVFSTGGTIFVGIKDGIVSAFKTIVNALIDGINKVVAKPFEAINSTLSKIKNINVLGTTPFKNVIRTISIPKIPKLATGGVVNRPTYAQIGEAGREAVLPLDRNTEWMNELAKKINANGGVVNVYLDGRLIQRQVSQREEQLNFATNGGM